MSQSSLLDKGLDEFSSGRNSTKSTRALGHLSSLMPGWAAGCGSSGDRVPRSKAGRQNGLEELEIYFTRERPDLGGPSVVRQIRVTSPFFRTLSGISIRNSFSEIIDSFPNLHRDEELTYALNGGQNEKEIEMFVDQTRGIAFEFRSGESADPNVPGYCRAIHVFRPGTNPRVMEAFDQPPGVP